MIKNVGGYDRLGRLIVGPILVVVGLAGFGGVVPIGTVGSVLALFVGLVFVATGYLQSCAVNRLLGIDTYRGSEPEPETTTEGES
ncbi:MAG: YgaP family membrane protein, partial [Halobacteriota archaeon]